VLIASLYVFIFIAAVPLNFGWEMAQARLYQPMGTFWQATFRCFVASLGDAAMTLLIGITGAALFRSWQWFVRPKASHVLFAAAAGLIVALVVEWWALRTGRWQYNPRIPLVPGTAFGVVPLAQMALLVPVTFWIANVRQRHTRDQS
jgi:hypothetical protein